MRPRLYPDGGSAHRRRFGAPGAVPALERDRSRRRETQPHDPRAHRGGQDRPRSRQHAQVLRCQGGLAGGLHVPRTRASGQSQRKHQLRRRGRGDGGHRRRVGLRQVHLRQGPDGPGNRHRRRGAARRDRLGQHRGQEAYPGATRIAADGVPEPQRHPQPVALRRLSDRTGHQALRHRVRPGQDPGPGLQAAGYG